MIDPLAEVVTLLQPNVSFSKVVSAAGAWRVRRAVPGHPFYCLIMEGACRLRSDEHGAITLGAGDFVLIPSAHGFTNSSIDPEPPAELVSTPVQMPNGEFRFGAADLPTDVRMLIGHCTFGSPDADLLVSLLPQLVHVRGETRLSTLVQLVIEESRAQRPARDVILTRLVEVLLIEALRSSTSSAASPGLVRGLADSRLAAAIKCMHDNPAHQWTVVELAKQAALSRSAFFERFSRAVGVAPMAYLMAWRMAIAKNLLRHKEAAIADIAERVGYSSASTFSVAFARHVGMPPASYAREQPEALLQ
ncbi:MAG: AraC family transcriptional regulator [Burkholderiaceae bacterium]|nr:AraC family transcriptional regulator [Burkholderiaceae bacterium]